MRNSSSRKGVRVDQETIMIFTNLAEWDAKEGVFSHKSPYYAGGDWQELPGSLIVKNWMF